MKRVLIVSYYWPPAGGVSVLRTLKIVKYLREFGWEPVVYCPTNAHYPYEDKNNENDLPEGLEVIKGPIIEPFKLFKFLSGRKKSQPLNSIVQVRDKPLSWFDKFAIWLRGNFFIPDARYLWIRPSVRRLIKYIKSNKIDALFSDGPPHTNTVICCRIAQKTGLPWLSDFQDPWTQVDYYQMLRIGRRAHSKHQRLEQECFKAASHITIASPSWKRDLESIGARNVDVVYYGFDEDDFSGLTHEESEYFDIVHTGLLGQDRHPRATLELLDEIAKDHALRLNLCGQIDIDVMEHLKSLKNIRLNILGTVPREQAIQLTIDADLLLLPLNKAENALGRLPGKLYEYLRSYNPILALGPPLSDASKILTHTKSGYCLAYEDVKTQSEVIMQWINSKKQTPDKEAVQGYSNKSQTARIASILDSII